MNKIQKIKETNVSVETPKKYLDVQLDKDGRLEICFNLSSEYWEKLTQTGRNNFDYCPSFSCCFQSLWVSEYLIENFKKEFSIKKKNTKVMTEKNMDIHILEFQKTVRSLINFIEERNHPDHIPTTDHDYWMLLELENLLTDRCLLKDLLMK